MFWFFFFPKGIKIVRTLLGSPSISSVFFSLKEAMVPSLQWLLLLWGLQGAWAVDYEDDYEEEKVPTRRRTKQLPSNVIPQNGKCKSE